MNLLLRAMPWVLNMRDLAIVENWDGDKSLAQVIQLERDQVSLQVFAGGKGLSTQARVRFLGHPSRVVYSPNILGRVFNGAGEPIDGGPDLISDPRIDVGGPSVNPTMRIVPKNMIETKVPMIDVFNCLVESQKIPIFSIAGEPFNQLLARIGIQADADIIVFGGLGLIFDDFHFFRTTFEDEGVFGRTVMFVNQASDPIVERMLVPDMALKVAERFAVDPSRLPNEEQTGRGISIRITRTRLIVACVVGVVAATAGGVTTIGTVHLEDHATVTAHRGASAAAPENTMAAVRQAIEDGTDWIEVDVQETADGEVAVFHDSDFMKLAGLNLKIWDATKDDLQDIDVGSWFAPEFRDERVPTLGKVLDACKGKAGVNIELKYYGHDKQLERRVADIVDAHGMASEVVIMSLKIDAVEKMKSIRPDLKIGLLMSVSAGALENLDADFFAINAAFANRRFIRSAHDMGREVYVWTVNDAPTMSAMCSLGVDSLITDEPALARSVLDQRAELSVPERLLLDLADVLGVASELGEP